MSTDELETVYNIPPEDWQEALSLPFTPSICPVVYRTSKPTFPCAAYCVYGKRFYTACGYDDLASPQDQLNLVNHFSNKYKATQRSKVRVVLASLAFPFRLFNFDGARLPEKPRTERVNLVEEYLVFIAPRSEIPISEFPVDAYWVKRKAEAKQLLEQLLPGRSGATSVKLVEAIVHATTSKNAKLGDTHYERLEFLGDATLTLLLSLACPSMAAFVDRKSNAFLDSAARMFRLEDFVQDTAPTVNRRISLATRGLQHVEAKKVLADVVEATLGALLLHLDLDACFIAGKTLGLFEKIHAPEPLTEEFAITYGKLVGTLAVFDKFPEISVGELHLERERVVGNRKSRDFRHRGFQIGVDSLHSVDTEIRNAVALMLGQDVGSDDPRSPDQKRQRQVGLMRSPAEILAEAEKAVAQARLELARRLEELEEAKRGVEKRGDVGV